MTQAPGFGGLSFGPFSIFQDGRRARRTEDSYDRRDLTEGTSKSHRHGRKTAQGDHHRRRQKAGHHRQCVVQEPSEMGRSHALTDTVASAYDAPESLTYQITLNCAIGADVRHIAATMRRATRCRLPYSSCTTSINAGSSPTTWTDRSCVAIAVSSKSTVSPTPRPMNSPSGVPISTLPESTTQS